MIVMPFDTETTGIPDWKIPSDDPSQPHMAAVAAMLVDHETGEELDRMDVIVRPDDWEIAPETIEIHGITMERAMDEGIPESEAVERLLALYSRAARRTAFNTTFDNRILRIAMKRHLDDSPEAQELMRSWKEDKELYYCCMINARKIMGGKQPTLAEAYTFFTGRELEGAHSAMNDTLALRDIYVALKDRGAA